MKTTYWFHKSRISPSHMLISPSYPSPPPPQLKGNRRVNDI